jgi:plasmid stabilization system protein ParE
MPKARFLPSATKDYEDACTWYYERSELAAERFEEAVERALDDVVEAPERWPLCDRRHRQHLLRKYPYSIVYRLVDDTVLIVAVAHARRRFGYWKRRR